MIEKAIKKINAEIQKAPNDTYRAIIGEYIIDHILTEDDAAKVLDDEKTLEGVLQHVISKAEREVHERVGYQTVAMVSMTVFDWVLEYFGLESGETTYPQTTAGKREEKPSKKGVVLALEDFFS